MGFHIVGSCRPLSRFMVSRRLRRLRREGEGKVPQEEGKVSVRAFSSRGPQGNRCLENLVEVLKFGSTGSGVADPVGLVSHTL